MARVVSSIVLMAAPVAATLAQSHDAASAAGTTPIEHVVVVDQENHSFNEVLGWMCDTGQRCNGSRFGKLHTGKRIELRRAPDIVPGLKHTIQAQRKAINNGRMNGFSTVHGCTKDRHYACYQRYAAKQIPNLAALAQTFTISDHTFETDVVSSWGSHLEIAAATLDGFTGDNPEPTERHPDGRGWGCDSFRDAPWRASPGSPIVWVPSCVPDLSGLGPYRESPVDYVPTILTRLDEAGLPWHIYRPPDDLSGPRLPYGWAICPSFAECQYGPQADRVVRDTRIIADAKQGRLPAFSIVIPQGRNSQHNGWSMKRGDNWIGAVLDAIMQGPDWASTAVFITYDDCGCFYDNVRPPKGLGIRVPMVIVSPFARPATTDRTVATFGSLLAFTERVFGLEPLTRDDASAYDYFGAFNFSQEPLPGIPMHRHPLPHWEIEWLRTHQPPSDQT